MGNGVTGFSNCCAGTTTGAPSRQYDVGHSFCYVRPDLTGISNSSPPERISETTTTFRSISGASVSANPSTSPITTASCPYKSTVSASTFQSSDNFASLPLQPLPRGVTRQSDPVKKPGQRSGLFESRFKSGPIENGSKEKPKKISRKKSCSKAKSNKKIINFNTILTNLISINVSRSKKNMIKPITSLDDGSSDSITSFDKHEAVTDHHQRPVINNNNSNTSPRNPKNQEQEVESKVGKQEDQEEKIQWAQGKAGEDRVHVILSEENEWLFVGIYDGFNGPDPPEYLLNNLYNAILKELKGLNSESDKEILQSNHNKNSEEIENKLQWRYEWRQGRSVHKDDIHKLRADTEWKQQQKNDENIQNQELDSSKEVLKALEEALKKTEEGFELMVNENPELALMGSCVLVALMKGEDVYVMNVGDSRAVLARRSDSNLVSKKKELERIKEESELDCEEESFAINGGRLVPIQLNMEHSTSVKEEVMRIKSEHIDDDLVIEKDRVKGYLKVTRAFGVGFLKQPKLNDALLEMFRINYVGESPYITCSPSLHHHRLTSRDKFLILSSDGLYEYFSNEEAIFEVESFISTFPEGDPAQHLIQEVLLRAAKKYDMDFHELLEIPQGDRRKYHDDVSVIVIYLKEEYGGHPCKYPFFVYYYYYRDY